MRVSESSLPFVMGCLTSLISLITLALFTRSNVLLGYDSSLKTVVDTSVSTTLVDNEKEYKCLTTAEMKDIVSEHPQAFILSPPKGGGTSLNTFASRCSKVPSSTIVNSETPVTTSFNLPSVISAHLGGPGPIMRLAKQSATSSVIFYSHRLETSRLKSAIMEVITYRLLDPPVAFNQVWAKDFQESHDFKVESNGTHYILPEHALVALIKDRTFEINGMASRILTCTAFDSLRENSPNFIFFNYMQGGNLQEILAEKHCPDLGAIHMNSNTSTKKKTNVVVTVPLDNSVHTVDDWIAAKINVLQWALEIKHENACQFKIRELEEKLFSCPTEFVQFGLMNRK